MTGYDRLKAALLVALTAACLAGAGAAARRSFADARAWPLAQAVDALPLHLAVQALRTNRDPTREADLAAVHAEARLDVRPDVFSTLYPASAPALLATVAPATWATFVPWWRRILLGAALVAGAAGGAAGVVGTGARRRVVVAAAVGAAMAALAFPIAEGARLGQINQLVAALVGIAMVGLAAGAAGIAAALLTLAGALKLVPALALLPLFTALRGRAVAVAAGTGLGVLAWTAAHLPLARVVAGVARTVAFERTSALHVVGELRPGAPAWMYQVVFVRHHPLALLTLALAAGVGWRGRDRPQALVGGVALVVTWLAADATALNTLYVLLALPAFAWALGWPLAGRAPPWSPLAAVGLLAPVLFLTRSPWPGPFTAVLVAELAWLGVAARAVTEAGPLGRRAWGVVAVAGLAAVASVVLEPRPPSYRGEVPAFVPMPPPREGSAPAPAP